MAKSVESKDETIEQRVARLETGHNWVSGIVRKLIKEVKEHFGIDVAVAILFAMFASSALAADTTIIDWGTGVSGTIGTAKVTSDGSVATLTVDKVVSASGTTSKGRAVVTAPSTTDFMVEGKVATMAAGQTTFTNTFATPFTSVPAFVYNSNHSTNPVATVTTGYVTIAFAATNITVNFIAVGAKSN